MIIKAARFAEEKHRGQVRKYSGAPYINHVIRVAGRFATSSAATENSVATAFLHDVVEDCNVTHEDIEIIFNPSIAELVYYLTSPKGEPGDNRKERKRLQREKIKSAPLECKVIKLIDRIDNLLEIDLDEDFSRLYAQESLLLVDAINLKCDLSDELRALAYKIISKTC